MGCGGGPVLGTSRAWGLPVSGSLALARRRQPRTPPLRPAAPLKPRNCVPAPPPPRRLPPTRPTRAPGCTTDGCWATAWRPWRRRAAAATAGGSSWRRRVSCWGRWARRDGTVLGAVVWCVGVGRPERAALSRRRPCPSHLRNRVPPTPSLPSLSITGAAARGGALRGGPPGGRARRALAAAHGGAPEGGAGAAGAGAAGVCARARVRGPGTPAAAPLRDRRLGLNQQPHPPPHTSPAVALTTPPPGRVGRGPAGPGQGAILAPGGAGPAARGVLPGRGRGARVCGGAGAGHGVGPGPAACSWRHCLPCGMAAACTSVQINFCPSPAPRNPGPKPAWIR
jgi:hypothetical protein